MTRLGLLIISAVWLAFGATELLGARGGGHSGFGGGRGGGFGHGYSGGRGGFGHGYGGGHSGFGHRYDGERSFGSVVNRPFGHPLASGFGPLVSRPLGTGFGRDIRPHLDYAPPVAYGGFGVGVTTYTRTVDPRAYCPYYLWLCYY